MNRREGPTSQDSRTLLAMQGKLLMISIVGRKIPNQVHIQLKTESQNSGNLSSIGRFPMQLQTLIGVKKDPKMPRIDEPNKRILSKLKATQGQPKPTTGDRSQIGKDSQKRQNKKSRKRRRGNDDSRSTSHDKNSTIVPGKQIKITKDKHFLNPNLSKIMRKSMNECSQGQEKTLKLNSKQKEKLAQEEKRRQLDTFNETIRKNNLKSMQISKDHRGDSLVASNVNISTPAASVPTNPMGNYARKLNKIMRVKKDTDVLRFSTENGNNLMVEKSSPLKIPLVSLLTEADKKKRTSYQMKDAGNQVGSNFPCADPVEGKKGSTITFKKISSDDNGKQSASITHHRHESKEKNKDPQIEERPSSEDAKKRLKSRPKKESKRAKQIPSSDMEKIKENLAKLNQKARHVLKQQTKGVVKRLNRQRRSKSSNDLISDQLIKKMLGRSDSVNIKPGHNEDQMYQEFKSLISKEKKGQINKDTALKDKIMKKPIKDKAFIPKTTSSKPIKLKHSKSSKVYRRPDSHPNRLKRLPGGMFLLPLPSLTPVAKDTHSSDKVKEREILDKIHQLSAKIQKNYENIPNLLLKTRNPPSQSTTGVVPISNQLKKSKKCKTKSSKRKAHQDIDGSDDICPEEKELIDKEILMPKSSSDYNSGDLAVKHGIDQANLQHQESRIKEIGKFSQINLDDSQKSMKIRDSQSSDEGNNTKSDDDNKDMYQNLQREGLDKLETPRVSQEDPLSKDNLDKWMYLLKEFKKCQSSGNIDGDLKDLLISFCDKTQRGLAQLMEEGNFRKGISVSDQKQVRPESPKEDSKRRKRPNLGIDVDNINEGFKDNPECMDVKENRSSSFQWLRAEFEQNLGELAKLLGKNKEETLKKIQVAFE